MKKILLTAMLLGVLFPAQAQWRAGITLGSGWNYYSIDKHYMTDWYYEGLWGATMGVVGQYDFTDWLAVRADVNWTQKNHRQYRSTITKTDYETTNDYLQLPVMASFSFGGQKVRGFLNLGVYGGYWLCSRQKGTYTNTFTDKVSNVDECMAFNSDRDQRWDCGLTGGIGLEYRFFQHWAAQVETRCYYSTTSIQKDYMQLKDPKYNTTIGLQAAIFYIF